MSSESVSIQVNNDSGNNSNSPLLGMKRPKINRKSQNLFDDGRSRIDYVLVYKDKIVMGKKNVEQGEYRDEYENKLYKKGLRLEYENKTENESIIYGNKNENTEFVKIHAPIKILKEYAQKLKLRMPIRESIVQKDKNTGSKSNGITLFFKAICTTWNEQQDYKITAEYSQNKSYLFDDNNEYFFSTSDRCMIVSFILEEVGLSKLLDEKVYSTAYPPHEGILNSETLKENRDSIPERVYLSKFWASAKYFSSQPVDEIKNYFGMKFALYFVWFDFYTLMLIPPAILGLLPIIYGISTGGTDVLSEEICNETHSKVMCPRPGQPCDFDKLSNNCLYYKFRYVVDNYATYVFAFLMSIWSALYLEFWKRHSAEIMHRWGLSGFSLVEEQPRPKYVRKLNNEDANSVTNTAANSSNNKDAQSSTNTATDTSTNKDEESITNTELNVPFWSEKIPRIVLSYILVIIVICLVLLFLFSTVLYTIFYPPQNIFEEFFFVPVTMAILINIFNALYSIVAEWLTELEYQRTQVEFDNSLQLKTYLFHFTTSYFPLFYTAFLKGRYVGTPAKYITIFGQRQEECDLGGCMLEVCIQLAIFMVCEQLINNFFEYIWPHIITFHKSLWKERKFGESMKNFFKNICGIIDESADNPRWKEDIKLNEWNTQIISEEYLEMVVQYGFITIFVTSFPLAPLLALLNNALIEKHLDAHKFIRNYRRPVAERITDVGIWFEIMKTIANISIITNACIIAFATNLIPRILYTLGDIEGKDEGFLDYSFSIFNLSDSSCNTANLDVDVCLYNEIKRDKNHKRTFVYWHIQVVRLLFIILYVIFVFNIVTVIDWFIPDVPEKLKVAIKKEEHAVTKEMLDYSKREEERERLLYDEVKIIVKPPLPKKRRNIITT